jgi:hypothetical protein
VDVYPYVAIAFIDGKAQGWQRADYGALGAFSMQPIQILRAEAKC